MNRQACPYCGKLYERVEWHTRYCLSAPAVRALVLQAMTDPDKPGCAVSRDAYDLRAREIGAATARALIDQLGKWATVCAVFGLKPPARRGGYRPHAAPVTERLAALDAEVERMQAAAEPANPYREWSGLPVCGVREIDGGRRLAWMVR